MKYEDSLNEYEFVELVIRDILNLFDEYHLELKSSKISNTYEQSILQIIIERIYINFDSILELLNSFKFDPKYFLPIAHLARAITTDYLNFYYLFLFYNVDKTDFRNELKLFDRDLYNAMIELNDVKFEIKSRVDYINSNNSKVKSQKIIDEKFNDIISNGKLYRTLELREKSKFNFNLIGTKSEPSRSFSEKQKYKNLKKYGISISVEIFELNKYFSQQYHFSTLSHSLLDKNVANNNLTYLIRTTTIFLTVFNIYNKSIFNINFPTIDEKYSKLFISIDNKVKEFNRKAKIDKIS